MKSYKEKDNSNNSSVKIVCSFIVGEGGRGAEGAQVPFFLSAEERKIDERGLPPQRT